VHCEPQHAQGCGLFGEATERIQAKESRSVSDTSIPDEVPRASEPLAVEVDQLLPFERHNFLHKLGQG
jgi:hypothetical protein